MITKAVIQDLSGGKYEIKDVQSYELRERCLVLFKSPGPGGGIVIIPVSSFARVDLL